MINFADNLENLTGLGNQGLEPVRRFAGVATEAFEQIARKNYEFCGDVMEFAVAQAKLPLSITEPAELLERQAASSREFVELVTTRANEYVELGKGFQQAAAGIVEAEAEAAAPARKPASRRTRKAA